VNLADRHFEMLETNGIRLRCVVEGDGPLVILLHGFPQCWYLWRHQIDPLIEQGWRVCVPDQRGYGMSDCPPFVTDYGIRNLCADVDGLATALGHDDYVLGIHDWGAVVGWNLALLYRRRVRAILGLSVPYSRDPRLPAMCTQEYWGEQFFYWAYFLSEVGQAEEEIERDWRTYLLRMYFGTSGDHDFRADPRTARTLLDLLPPVPDELPSWLTDDDLDYYVEMFQRSGARGPINWYRNIPLLLADTAELEGVKIPQPTRFVIGSRDPSQHFHALEGHAERFDDLHDEIVIEGAGHWLPLEATDRVNELMLEFYSEFVA
jgi:pimeloyl-ACP methyl ester carboxylesterase